MEAWRSKRKHSNLTELSASVGLLLQNQTRAEARELYQQIQLSETRVVTAGAAFDVLFEEDRKRSEAFDQAKKNLRNMVQAAVLIGPLADIEGSQAFSAFDKGDDLGLSMRLIKSYAQRGQMGASLSKLLEKHRKEFISAQSKLNDARLKLASAEQELGAQVLGLESQVVQARALLLTLGVTLTKRKKAKKPVRAVKPVEIVPVVEPPSPAPVPVAA